MLKQSCSVSITVLSVVPEMVHAAEEAARCVDVSAASGPSRRNTEMDRTDILIVGSSFAASTQ